MARGLVSVNERSEDGGPFLETVNEERIAHVQPLVGQPGGVADRRQFKMF